MKCKPKSPLVAKTDPPLRMEGINASVKVINGPHAIRDRLEEIAELIRQGLNAEDFIQEIDALTGDEEQGRDLYTEFAWQADNEEKF